MITRQVSVFKILCGCHVVPTTKNELDIVVYWQMGNFHHPEAGVCLGV